MINITLKDDSKEAFEKAMKLFKKVCQADGFIRELQERRTYKKPSVKRKEKEIRARNR